MELCDARAAARETFLMTLCDSRMVLLRHLVERLCGRPSAEERGVRTLLALAVWALLQVWLTL